MPGNKAGGLKAHKTNVKKHGPDFYKRIGAMGGSTSRNGGFAAKTVGKDGLTGPERARMVGGLGGKKSKRKSKE